MWGKKEGFRQWFRRDTVPGIPSLSKSSLVLSKGSCFPSHAMHLWQSYWSLEWNFSWVEAKQLQRSLKLLLAILIILFSSRKLSKKKKKENTVKFLRKTPRKFMACTKRFIEAWLRDVKTNVTRESISIPRSHKSLRKFTCWTFLLSLRSFLTYRQNKATKWLPDPKVLDSLLNFSERYNNNVKYNYCLSKAPDNVLIVYLSV